VIALFAVLSGRVGPPCRLAPEADAPAADARGEPRRSRSSLLARRVSNARGGSRRRCLQLRSANPNAEKFPQRPRREPSPMSAPPQRCAAQRVPPRLKNGRGWHESLSASTAAAGPAGGGRGRSRCPPPAPTSSSTPCPPCPSPSATSLAPRPKTTAPPHPSPEAGPAGPGIGSTGAVAPARTCPDGRTLGSRDARGARDARDARGARGVRGVRDASRLPGPAGPASGRSGAATFSRPVRSGVQLEPVRSRCS